MAYKHNKSIVSKLWREKLSSNIIWAYTCIHTLIHKHTHIHVFIHSYINMHSPDSILWIFAYMYTSCENKYHTHKVCVASCPFLEGIHCKCGIWIKYETSLKKTHIVLGYQLSLKKTHSPWFPLNAYCHEEFNFTNENSKLVLFEGIMLMPWGIQLSA